jgi:poly(3-hydroxybutyrate) depolymerase
MHGSSRDAEGLRNRWAQLAEKEGFVVLAPLFPVDMDVSLIHRGNVNMSAD